jgi:hypothetical protein
VTPRRLALSLGAIAGLAAAATGARADTSLSGVCPDGSYFIVQSRASIPCANAHVADPADLPPVRPYLLPKPYTWYVDQEARNPNNPYNLIETARKIREARSGVTQEGTTAAAPATHPTPPVGSSAPAPLARAESPAAAPLVSLADDELRDLVRLIALRQDAAPALFDVDDVHGARSLRIELAYSASFESFALATLGRDPSANRVIVWSAQAARAADFHPNFFVVQSGRTFRPDPQNPAELAFLLGAAGALPAGEMVVGYLVVPASFDPAGPLELFWNDRSVEAVLAPPSGGAGASH